MKMAPAVTTKAESTKSAVEGSAWIRVAETLGPLVGAFFLMTW